MDDIICKTAIIQDVNKDNNTDNNRKQTIKPNEYVGIALKSSKAKSITRLKCSSAIGIDYSFDREAIATIDLIKSDNKCLNKTIAVFVQLSIEVRQLSKEGQQLLIKCLFADEELCELLNEEDDADNIDGSNRVNDNEINGIALSPQIINKISDLLEMLFQAQLFIERCFVVISEIIKQFSALFAAENSNYINVDHSSLHFQVK